MAKEDEKQHEDQHLERLREMGEELDDIEQRLKALNF